MGDADGDADLDWGDFEALVDNLTGASVERQLVGWWFFDVDMDEDVDLSDLAVFELAFTGP